MTPYDKELLKRQDYADAFHMYYQYVGRNKRYANTYLKKMEKIKKTTLKTITTS